MYQMSPCICSAIAHVCSSAVSQHDIALLQVGNLGDVYHFVPEDSAQHDNTGRAIYSLRVVDSKPEMTVALQTEEHVRRSQINGCVYVCMCC